MSILLNGDCLEQLKDIEDKSVDLIFCDLPYATDKYSAVNCKWNTPIDLDKLWIEFMRIKKLNTPIIMTTTTKFGVDLIDSAPKKCPFRYDLVWCKSASCGFLSAKKQPLRKHEMIYVFYEKLPFYDLSSHKHKFKKEYNDFNNKDGAYGVIKSQKGHPEPLYDPPLPDSLVKEPEPEYSGTINTLYTNNIDVPSYVNKRNKKTGMSAYEPPLPNSIIKEDIVERKVKEKNSNKGGLYTNIDRLEDIKYEPPLPNSLLEIKSTRGKHSTEKPVNLMCWILKYYSKEDDTILDPTMGSGSMGVACKEMNRNFIGIEKDPEIYEVAVNRIEN